MEDDHRAYREAIASAIRILRPRAEVATSGLHVLSEEAVRLDPDVVICSRPESALSDDKPTWVELSLDPTQPTRVRLGGTYSERNNPTLEVLLAIIDEVEQLLQTESDPESRRESR